jgi:radical SAM superfamily enzyme YgiQ (UPF0313 family)
MPDGPARSVLLVSTYDLGRQPFGLASAAAWLAQAGAEVRCADVAIESAPSDELIEASAMVGFYVPMHTATRLAIPLAERVHRVNPRAHICFFGLYAVPNEERLREVGAQTILSGEFEQGLVAAYRGVCAGEADGAPVVSISRARQHFIRPDRSRLPGLREYARVRVAEGEEKVAGHTEASRGCKHRCRHCPIVPVYDGKFRVVDVATVMEDVDQQVDQGARHVTFGDPDFWNGPGHARTIVQELRRRHPDVTYDVTIKVEHLLRHAGDLPLLRDTGCLFVTSAVEAVDDRILEMLEKGHTRADVVTVLELFRDIGLALTPTFVAFTPWTSLESYLDLLRFIYEHGLAPRVSPIQLAIRLLVPAGSRLLELESIRQVAGPLDRAALYHPWKHADARVDDLQQRLITRVNKAASRSSFFVDAWNLVHEAAGLVAPPLAAHRLESASFIPHVTEPWYCCAEPVEEVDAEPAHCPSCHSPAVQDKTSHARVVQ